MDPTKPQKIADLLGAGALGALADQARARRSTAASIRQRLPAAEADQLVAAHFEEDGTLVLVMSSAAWAARVRYRAEDLEVARLRVCVAPRGGSA
jgi:hypothetical protein